MAVDGLKIEKATNFLLREVAQNFATTLAAVDTAMADEDNASVEFLGREYGALDGTPRPRTWRIGHVPNYILVPYHEYPVVAVWGHEQRPLAEQQDGDWGINRARFMLQGVMLGADTIYLARFCYRYAATMQYICSNTTLGGLTDATASTGTIDISTAQFRETDDRGYSWYAQSVIYQFDADFVETGY